MFKKLTENWSLKLLSLVFALILWFFVIGERQVEIGFTVPIEYINVPQGMMIANEVPNLVDIRLTGPRTLLVNLSSGDISFSVDLADLKPGLTSFKRLEERLDIPGGLKVTRISPSFVDVRLERVRSKTVPVQVVFSGELAEGYQLDGFRVSPERVEIEGAESEIRDVTEVSTQPVELGGARESFTLMVPLRYQGRYSRLKEEQTVELQVRILPPPPAEIEYMEKGENSQ
ncbi:YbbR-like protein [Geoalkalibacter ferrihydriticus]|uniref:YbbR domain pair protein n=2 Tax=Geoalkalibacter ferrihydriticus TaxID=392333 RepID=A0A0C2EEP7_9BACT|nr:CdaR family protein [Geoalkalibacter ferrihydriticus]KIH77098.1 YbbR domain pair protein [Geoalkalibacter ferrihydriticus DSM 17813]SDL34500.1 YbbR-like protein [Geoalkalibacter ferrihydriticus]